MSDDQKRTDGPVESRPTEAPQDGAEAQAAADAEQERRQRVQAALLRHEARPKRERRWGRR